MAERIDSARSRAYDLLTETMDDHKVAIGTRVRAAAAVLHNDALEAVAHKCDPERSL